MATQVAVLISKIARIELKDWPELLPTLLKVLTVNIDALINKKIIIIESYTQGYTCNDANETRESCLVAFKMLVSALSF